MSRVTTEPPAGGCDPERFEGFVEQALDGVPAALADQVRNVVVLVQDDPPPGQPADLLGLYDGVALTERQWTDGFELPDRILIFRRPLLAHCRTADGGLDEQRLVEEVRVTVVHEIAHHFGIDDDRLDELGYA